MALATLVLGMVMAAQSPAAAGAPPPEAVTAYQPAPGDADNFWRYFFFWRGGTTAEAARADLAECGGYARDPALWARIPERMPLEGGVQGADGSGGQYGLVGVAMFSLVQGGLERRIALANMRRCMGFKGYRRYGLSAALWEPLNRGSPEQVVDRLAAIAAGAEPRQASVAP
ncbi:MAG TPA: hypothetical protein VGB54_05350 [Allosphingosinicella sp.]|jgi:hypothetical protein